MTRGLPAPEFSRELILASSSPQRRELLQRLGIIFKVAEPQICEERQPAEPPQMLVQRLARLKCQSIADRCPDAVVLGADTVVSLDGMILGKPHDLADARHMLRMLSGREHVVYTGVCVQCGAACRSIYCAARVVFDQLPEHLLDEYLKCGESLSKAGAYALQGRAAAFISEISGSVSSVIGLPLSQTRRLLEEFGLRFRCPEPERCAAMTDSNLKTDPATL